MMRVFLFQGRAAISDDSKRYHSSNTKDFTWFLLGKREQTITPGENARQLRVSSVSAHTIRVTLTVFFLARLTGLATQIFFLLDFCAKRKNPPPKKEP
jgi:hypothetical protein